MLSFSATGGAEREYFSGFDDSSVAPAQAGETLTAVSAVNPAEWVLSPLKVERNMDSSVPKFGPQRGQIV